MGPRQVPGDSGICYMLSHHTLQLGFFPVVSGHTLMHAVGTYLGTVLILSWCMHVLHA